MAYTSVGRIRPRARGSHNAASTYSVLDIATNAAGTIAYMAVRNVPAGIAITNTAYWVEFANVSDLIGPTPQKGVDYWTDADKAEIKSYVDDAILGGEW